MEDTKSHRVADDAFREAARQDLRSWAKRQRGVTADRDRFVSNALSAGLSKEEVHMLTGLGRSTIDRIMTAREVTP